MKKVLLVASLAFAWASCGSGDKAESHDHDAAMHEDHEMSMKEAGANAQVDPSCGMERTADWTDYSVKGTDTTWYCSPHCKEEHEAKEAKQG